MATGRCVLKYRRVSPTKARLLADLIRGKSVSEARVILALSTKRAKEHLSKALSAAVASYKQKVGDFDEDNLVVSKVVINPGPTWRIVKPGIKPMRFGGYNLIKRRTSHITVEVSPLEEED